MHRTPPAGELPADDEAAFDSHEPEPGLPCAEALLAGTVALMTTWADPCPNCTLDVQAQRSLMARKVASNLFFLREHPALSAGLRQVMGLAHQRWVALASSCEAERTRSEGQTPGALH